ncbi:MAG TPA: disulfide bond formation protein B [Candidatus Paceibacterota bacterium]|nr:disulfide bond formation protein B [Candidatus Paceibacterota bacterium]
MDIGILMTKGLALVTVLGNIASIGVFGLFLFARSRYESFMRFVAAWALPLGFFLAFGSTAGSLLYSEVMGFPACILCWIQRIFMYPQMFLYWLALYRRDAHIAPYGLLLSVLGGAVALYQWVKDMIAQYSDGLVIPCPAVEGLPSCDTIYVWEFGYVSIPMIALNAFVLIGIVMFASIRYGGHAKR